jgi:hypothetical protein
MRDGHDVTVAAPPNVVNLERGYLQLTAFDDCPGNGRALDGSSQGVVDDRDDDPEIQGAGDDAQADDPRRGRGDVGPLPAW